MKLLYIFFIILICLYLDRKKFFKKELFDGLNMFQRRKKYMDKVKKSLKSSHEMKEKSFDDILKDTTQNKTVEDPLFKNSKFLLIFFDQHFLKIKFL